MSDENIRWLINKYHELMAENERLRGYADFLAQTCEAQNQTIRDLCKGLENIEGVALGPGSFATVLEPPF